jgi:hypothetical protein
VLWGGEAGGTVFAFPPTCPVDPQQWQVAASRSGNQLILPLVLHSEYTVTSGGVRRGGEWGISAKAVSRTLAHGVTAAA